MDWFFGQYVYGTGVPEYRLEWQAAEAGTGQWRIRGKVTQSGVPTGWLDALPLYARISGKVMRIGLITCKRQDNPIEFTMPFKPEKLILNYLEDTLAIIR